MDISNITINTHSSIRIDNGCVIYIDPFQIPDQAQDADYIFITHDHYDHFSVEDIEKVAKPGTVLVFPKAMEKKTAGAQSFGESLFVEPGNSYETKDFSFETVPAYNKLKPFHPKSAGWVGYIIEAGGERIYVAGDTDRTKEAQQVKCDIAIVPAGGTYTMDYKEAAALVNAIKPRCAIPMHYGNIVGKSTDGESFSKLTDEGIQVSIKLA